MYSRIRFSASWSITSVCNYDCLYCYRYRDEKILEVNEAYQIVDRLYELGCRKLSLAGGEPLCWHSKNAVFDLVSHIKSKGMLTELITNGWFLEKGDLDVLKGRLDILTIDVDSLCDQIQFQLGRPVGHIARAKRLHLYAKKLGMKIKMNTVVTSVNFDCIPEMCNYVREAGFYRWKIYQFMPILDFSEKERSLIVDKNAFEALRKEIEHEMENGAVSLVTENNRQMADSYMNINPQGVIHTNRIRNKEQIIKYEIGKVSEVGLEKMFSHFAFDEDKFLRYHQMSNYLFV